jgi:hypothetical protein
MKRTWVWGGVWGRCPHSGRGWVCVSCVAVLRNVGWVGPAHPHFFFFFACLPPTLLPRACSAFDAMHPREREERYGSPVVLIAAAECVGLDTTFPSASLTGVRVVVTPVDALGRLLGKDRAAAVGRGEGELEVMEDPDSGDGAGPGDTGADHRITFSNVFCFSEVRGWHDKAWHGCLSGCGGFFPPDAIVPDCTPSPSLPLPVDATAPNQLLSHPPTLMLCTVHGVELRGVCRVGVWGAQKHSLCVCVCVRSVIAFHDHPLTAPSPPQGLHGARGSTPAPLHTVTLSHVHASLLWWGLSDFALLLLPVWWQYYGLAGIAGFHFAVEARRFGAMRTVARAFVHMGDFFTNGSHTVSVAGQRVRMCP